jgi:hypothetical protein
MARPLRLECEGALYHITSRGNERGTTTARIERENRGRLRRRLIQIQERLHA